MSEPYRDRARSVEERVEDLLARMSLEEKAGLMFHPPAEIGDDGSLVERPGMAPAGTRALVTERHLTNFNIYGAPEPRLHAEWHNRRAAASRDACRGSPDDRPG